MPYLGLAAALVVLAVAIAAFRLPKIENTAAGAGAANSEDGGFRSAWSYRHLSLGAIGIFVYVGAEVSIGSVLVNYFREPIMGGLSASDAADAVSYYWGGAMVGRFIGSLLTLRLYKPGKVLAAHGICAAVLTVITMLASGFVGRWAILAVGLFNSIMFPTIFTEAIDGLGRHTGQASGILCMAIVGGAVIPPLTGKLADAIGIHYCFILPAVCYLYIAWYGLKGRAADTKKPAVAAA
jgi:FHS family L-fucose permease-like MFS transporter